MKRSMINKIMNWSKSVKLPYKLYIYIYIYIYILHIHMLRQYCDFVNTYLEKIEICLST